jgi:hypothetical protein
LAVCGRQLEKLLSVKKWEGFFHPPEPLLSSAGMGVATEAEEYLRLKAVLSNLQKAVQSSKNMRIETYTLGITLSGCLTKYKHGAGERPLK